MNRLTEKQALVLQFIQHYITEHRRAPFIREIQVGCRITSYKSVIDRLNALEHKGFIKRTPNKHRAIRVAPSAVASIKARQIAAAETVDRAPLLPAALMPPETSPA